MPGRARRWTDADRVADPRFGGGDLAGIGKLPFGRLGQPIAVGQAPGLGPRRRPRPAELGGERGVAVGDLLGPAALLVAEPQPLLGGVEQGAQQLPLPVVPGARPDRANVDHGEDQQQPQPLRALHRARRNPRSSWDRRGRGGRRCATAADDGAPARPRSRSRAASSPKRGHSSSATSAPSTLWSPPRPLAMSWSSTAT